jgi:hypothetical protein
MEYPSYVISTNKGSIPHIIDASKGHLNKPLQVYVEDIYYKQSYHYQGGKLSLNEFLNTNSLMFLTLKDRILNTVRGNLRIREDEYNALIKICKPYAHSSFNNPALLSNGESLYNPTDLSDMVSSLLQGYKIISTDFVNKMTLGGKLLYFRDNILHEKEINELTSCECCREYNGEYIKYLWNINEMNVFTIITSHNYFQLNEFFETLKENLGILNEIEVKC